MFGRRNPDQQPVGIPPVSPNHSDEELDLDLMPDLPAIPDAAPQEPEPPPSDPAWHAGALPTPAPWETPPPSPAPPAASVPVVPPPPTPPAQAPVVAAMPPIPAFQPAAVPQAVPRATATVESAPALRTKPISESVIGPDDFFDGRYRSERGVRIQGNARGSIESRQYIFVEGGAEVEADLSAEDITVAGSFNGKIECRRRLEVTSSGKIQGHVTTALLVVHEGGLVDGELHMQRDEGQPEQG